MIIKILLQKYYFILLIQEITQFLLSQFVLLDGAILSHFV